MTVNEHGSGDPIAVVRRYLERAGLRVLDIRWRRPGRDRPGRGECAAALHGPCWAPM